MLVLGKVGQFANVCVGEELAMSFQFVSHNLSATIWQLQFVDFPKVDKLKGKRPLGIYGRVSRKARVLQLQVNLIAEKWKVSADDIPSACIEKRPTKQIGWPSSV